MTKSYILHAESGHYEIHGGEVNFSVERIAEAVELETRIPPDAKMAVKDYIESVLRDAGEIVENIIGNIPQELSEYSEVIIEIIKSFIS